jgi:hypothetical protein
MASELRDSQISDLAHNGRLLLNTCPCNRFRAIARTFAEFFAGSMNGLMLEIVQQLPGD